MHHFVLPRKCVCCSEFQSVVHCLLIVIKKGIHSVDPQIHSQEIAKRKRERKASVFHCISSLEELLHFNYAIRLLTTKPKLL